jgi:hypothetical protein
MEMISDRGFAMADRGGKRDRRTSVKGSIVGFTDATPATVKDMGAGWIGWMGCLISHDT